MERQVGQRWAARGVLLLTLLGLVAMHGLPDAMAGSNLAASTSSHAPMPTMGLMPSRSSVPLPFDVAMRVAERGPAAHARHHAPVDRPVRVSQAGPRAAAPGLAGPTGCAMDHVGCTAVLRDAEHPPAAAPAVAAQTALAATEAPTPSQVFAAARGPRAPPDVSLVGLGISRT